METFTIKHMLLREQTVLCLSQCLFGGMIYEINKVVLHNLTPMISPIDSHIPMEKICH